MQTYVGKPVEIHYMYIWATGSLLHFSGVHNLRFVFHTMALTLQFYIFLFTLFINHALKFKYAPL